jgi:hypothetical protein
MSKHLSEDDITRIASGLSARANMQHLQDCAECSNRLGRFDNAISLFRSAIHDRVDTRLALHAPAISVSSIPNPVVLTWRHRLAAAAVILVVLIPLIAIQREALEVRSDPSVQATSPDALMDAVNLRLSRTMPASMERVLVLIPNDEATTESGGAQ